jgi:pimeloyl-ACP methyl ester carboxylesterase
MADQLSVQYFEGRDGLRLAYRETGKGRPLVLVHGYFSTATENWVRYGTAAALAARGYRVVMPDLRGHGDSDRPRDPAAYPPDALADDAFALLERLGLTDYDLGGYSLGARTVVRLLARGATPRRAVAAGVGLSGISDAVGRGAYYRRILTHLGTFERGSSEWRAEAFLRTIGGDPEALLHVLDTQVDTPVETLASLPTPTLVLVGAQDEAHESAKELAAALPESRFAVIPGNHMSAVTKPDFGAAIADFLGTAAEA